MEKNLFIQVELLCNGKTRTASAVVLIPFDEIYTEIFLFFKSHYESKTETYVVIFPKWTTASVIVPIFRNLNLSKHPLFYFSDLQHRKNVGEKHWM